MSELTWDPTVRRTTHERYDARGDDGRGYRISRMTYDDDQPGPRSRVATFRAEQ
jgi:hypothetical protein